MTTMGVGHKNLLAILVLFAVIGAAACNTAEGIGEDLESAGEKVGDAVD